MKRSLTLICTIGPLSRVSAWGIRRLESCGGRYETSLRMGDENDESEGRRLSERDQPTRRRTHHLYFREETDIDLNGTLHARRLFISEPLLWEIGMAPAHFNAGILHEISCDGPDCDEDCPIPVDFKRNSDMAEEFEIMNYLGIRRVEPLKAPSAPYPELFGQWQ